MSGILSRVLTGVGFNGTIAPVVANTDYLNAVGDITTQTKEGVTNGYYTTIQGINSVAQVGQQWVSTRINQSFMVGQIDMSVYELMASWEKSETDIARMDRTLEQSGAGVSTIPLLRSLCDQGIAQKLRLMALWGLEAGEGLINSATSIEISNDPQSNSTVVTYDPFWFCQKIMGAIRKVMDAVYNTDSHISLLTSVEVFNYLTSTTIKSTDYLATGSAVTIADFLKERVKSMGRELMIGWDATLSKCDSAKAKDAIYINAPGIRLKEEPKMDSNVNAFAINANNVPFNTTMDVAGYRNVDEPTFRRVMSGYSFCTTTAGVTLRAGTSAVMYVTYSA